MRYIIITLVLSFLALETYSQEKGEVSVPLSNPEKIGRLQVDMRKGKVKVIGTTRKDVYIQYEEVKSKGYNESAEEDPDKSKGLTRIGTSQLDLRISEDGNVVRIVSDSWGGGANLVVEVPKRFHLVIDSYMGDLISVESVNGEISLEGYTGSIRGKELGGTVSASTYAGSIEVHMNEVIPGQPMAFSTYAGSVDLTFPENLAADLKMKTKWGSIFTGFDVELQASEQKLIKQSDEKGFKMSADTWTFGKINGGGPEITIKTSAGSIYVKKN